MRPTRLTLSALLIFLLAACNLPRPEPDPGTATPTDTPTATVRYEDCGWQWATQALPELSAQVEAALQAAGLPVAAANAEAYGENCMQGSDNQVAYFAAMETDFHITLEASDLSDEAALGDLLEQTLVVLDGFPPGATAGPQAGYVGVTFQAGTDELRLWFPMTDGESARALGLHGAELLNELENR
jgi:hypothetical protein